MAPWPPNPEAPDVIAAQIKVLRAPSFKATRHVRIGDSVDRHERQRLPSAIGRFHPSRKPGLEPSVLGTSEDLDLGISCSEPLSPVQRGRTSDRRLRLSGLKKAESKHAFWFQAGATLGKPGC